ncbi:MAG: patatin-like phospholipase family protein [Bacteroidota bacterium]
MKKFLKNIFHFFPVQLFLVHFKRNQVLTFFWIFLFGFTTKLIFDRIGAASLFLSPEYFDKVDFWSFLILGLAMGSFIIAFNISSYIVNAHYFPFIATLSRPFLKYTINNFSIPVIFIIVYIIYSIKFQYYYEYLDYLQITYNICGFLIGIFIFIFISISYFFSTNSDIFRMFNLKKSHKRGISSRPIRVIMQHDLQWKKLNSPPNNSGNWRIETYLAGIFKIRRARDFEHYSDEMIFKVLKQNHKNASFFAVAIILLSMILGIFMDYDFFMIPAGASILLLFTILIMFYSAIKSLFKEWAIVAIIIIILSANYIGRYFFFDYRNSAYGLNYYNKSGNQDIEGFKYFNSFDFQCDYMETLRILNNWKKKNTDPANPGKLPKLVFINTSGGGMKAMIWTYYSLAYADSILDGNLLNKTHLITGASGGMIGAAYLRELYLLKQNDVINSYFNDSLLIHLSKDILNPVAFSFSLNDWFFKIKRFSYKGNSYYKDRAYSFEKKLNENTGNILDKTLADYKDPEFNSLIPMMIFTPTVINDGRTMIVSSQNVSYLLANEFNKVDDKPSLVEFRRLYADFDADSIRYTTVLRMNATFPYVAPIVAMPGNPQYQVMDAGIRDNYGLSVTINFINSFKDWISKNTSGIVIVQISEDTDSETEERKSILFQFFRPLGNVYKNLFNIQQMHNNQLIEYSENWLLNNIEFVNLNLQSKESTISLSWRLSAREKNQIINSIDHPKNQQALDRLKDLLN